MTSSNWSFINHITDYLARPRIGESKPPTLWPSEATAIRQNKHGEEEVVGKCRRASFFRYLKDCYKFYEKYSFYEPLVTAIEKEYVRPDVYVQWIWRQGELYEQYCQDMAKESGVYIGDQIQIYIPGANVSGKIDLIVINPGTGLYNIIEIKSVYGFNANTVLGTPSQRSKGALGEPRDSHLMQLAIYDWRLAKTDPERYGPSKLVYGARDTGRYAEYEVFSTEDTDLHPTNSYIHYKGNCPNQTAPVNSGISIQNTLDQYVYIQNCVDSGDVPARDYDLEYSEEKVTTLFNRGELNKSDTERYEKRKLQLVEGKKKPVKAVEKGDWQCRLCSYKNICYGTDGTPNAL
jgi:hypothetical protein